MTKPSNEWTSDEIIIHGNGYMSGFRDGASTWSETLEQAYSDGILTQEIMDKLYIMREDFL